MVKTAKVRLFNCGTLGSPIKIKHMIVLINETIFFITFLTKIKLNTTICSYLIGKSMIPKSDFYNYIYNQNWKKKFN